MSKKYSCFFFLMKVQNTLQLFLNINVSKNMLILPFSNPLIVEFTCKVYLNSHWKFFQKKNMDVNSPVNKNKQFHILIYGYTVEVEKLVFCQCALNLKDEDLIVA